MRERHWWRWVGLALIAVLAGLFASFNTGERVALNLGFTVLYQVPLVTLIFVAFLAGMTTMFLVGLRHDLRVRRALREAGFGEPIRPQRTASRWVGEEEETTQLYGAGPGVGTPPAPSPAVPPPPDDEPAAADSEAEPPRRYPP